ncbi:hypothetical protein NDU88_003187 [Pleurodeles waltl]|uniref:Uncharacterized protein n=1 Tax=Pleurodeles waltl TaxID=8319 RepID=A0AAV7QE62_PLEWA|nr:hypothetical protein NDU88_003187 [Pleurodeles waltl]
MWLGPTSGLLVRRAASSDVVYSDEALQSPPSGRLQHLRCVGKPGPGPLACSTILQRSSSMSSPGTGASSVPQGPGLQNCPGGPSFQAISPHEVPSACWFSLTSLLRCPQFRVEARPPPGRAPYRCDGCRRGSPTGISTVPLGNPPRRPRPQGPCAVAALRANAATPPRCLCVGLCARLRASHHCPTRARRTANKGSSVSGRPSAAERALHCSHWPHVFLLMPDKPGYEHGALTARVRHLR